MSFKKRGLGRGLSELGLDELLSDFSAPMVTEAPAELKTLPIDRVQPGRYQPRRRMTEEGLEELADSIRSQGIIQPIVVRPHENHYEIIAGERRWRAAQLAGLVDVPVIIRNIPDEAAIAMALIENIQRQDLNAMEEAIALQRLIDEFHMTHEEVAEAVGKSRSSVTNILRLLKLNADVQMLVEQGSLDMGHARALLALEGVKQSVMANDIVAKSLSVRETEKRIQSLLERSSELLSTKAVNPDVARLQNELSDRVGAVVTIRHQSNGRGKLIINYYSGGR